MGITTIIFLVCIIMIVNGFTPIASNVGSENNCEIIQNIQKVFVVPLELEGQLDVSKSWEVKFLLNGEEKIATVSEGDSLLESAEKLFDFVPSSCRNGVCTTCAAKILDGQDSTKLAVHGLGEPQIAAGFVCSCQCFPIGPGITIQLDAYDEVYESQYGQYEKSYEMKYGEREDEKKKKGFFGF